MALRWYYSVNASTVLEITDRVRTPGPDGEGGIVVGSHAEEGSGWEGSIDVDDPEGDFVPLMHRRIYAVEDSAPAGSQVMFNGFISNLDVIRGTPPVEASRIWQITLSDPNSLLSRRIFVGGSSARPAETDVARILWVLTETELNTLSPDLTYIDQTGPVDMDAADYTGQKPESVLSDCSQQSGKNYFVKYEEAAAVGGALVSSSVANPTVITTTTPHGFVTGMQVSIAGHSGSTPSINGIRTVTVTGANTFTIPVNVTVGGTGGSTSTVGRFVLCYFNANTSDLMPSTISLSNVESEIDETMVFAISDDTRLSRAGGRSPVSGMFGTFPGGYSYIQDPTIGDLYVYRDVSAPSINVKTQAIADARTARQLAELNEPDDEVETEINVDEAQVNLAIPGMSIPLHATHLPNYTEDDDQPGYAAEAQMRIMRRQVRQLSPERYGVRLWMTPMDAPIECNYEWLGTVTTEDALGGSISSSGYVAAASVYPATVVEISGGRTPFGTPNDGATWGLAPGVVGAGTYAKRWVWDLEDAGSPAICAVRLAYTSGHFDSLSIQASHDNVTWDTIVTAADYLTAGASNNTFAVADDIYGVDNLEYRYWSLLYSHTYGGGFFDGLDMRGVLFWAAT